MLFHLPDEVLHLIGQFIINTDQNLLESLYEGQLQSFTHSDFPFRSVIRHCTTASHFYLFLLGTLSRDFHHRVVFNPYFWKKNLFYLDQLTSLQIGKSTSEELYEEEYDEDLDEIVQIPVKERPPERIINFEQVCEMMERSEMRRIYLRAEASLIQSMIDRVNTFYSVRELIIDSNNVDLFCIMNVILFHCPFIEKLRVLAGRFISECNNSIQYFEKQSKELNCPLRQLRIIYQLPNSDNISPRIFEELLQLYLPHMRSIEEIVLPFWSPSILDSISGNCKKLKKLVLFGELVQGTYNNSFENIYNNIEGLESFVISRSRVKGFYVDIGQAHFMRILSKFSKTLKEFSIGTNLSRFSSLSPEDSIKYEEELAANIPTKLETLIVENIIDHYYNSSTPLAFINILTSLLNRKLTNNHLFHFKNLTIDLNNFNLENLKSISMAHVTNLYLRLHNSEQILRDLSNEKYTSNIQTLQLDMQSCDLSMELLSSILKKPFFSKLEHLLLVNDAELLDITPLSSIQNLKSLKLLSHTRYLNQHFEPLYRDDFSTRRVYSKSNGSFTLKAPTKFEEIDIVFEEELDLFESNLFSNITSMNLDIEYFYSDAMRVLSPLSKNFPNLEKFELTIQTDMLIDCAIVDKLRVMKNIKHACLNIESPDKCYNGLDLLILFYIFTFGAILSDFKCHYLIEPEEDILSIFDNIFFKFISEKDHSMYDEIRQSFTRQIVQHLNFGDSNNSSVEDD